MFKISHRCRRRSGIPRKVSLSGTHVWLHQFTRQEYRIVEGRLNLYATAEMISAISYMDLQGRARLRSVSNHPDHLKSSFQLTLATVTALAGRLRMDLYIVNPAAPGYVSPTGCGSDSVGSSLIKYRMDDSQLQKAFRKCPQNSLLLIEDM